MNRIFSVAASVGLLTLACLALAPAAHAQLVGTSVTGGLFFGTNPTNYFDPANGFVPAGYLNKTQGTTVTVANPAIEFGFQDSSNTDTVNITNNLITFTDAGSSGGSSALSVTLTDAAFAGGTFTKLSDTFAGGVIASLSGSTLSLRLAEQGNNTFTPSASFSFTPAAPAAVPEPGSVALLVGMALPVAGLLARRRQSA